MPIPNVRTVFVALAMAVPLLPLLLPAGAVGKLRIEEPNHCRSQGLGESGAPGEVSTPLEPSVLSRYAIFRRAATPADELSPLSGLESELEGALERYYPSDIRRLLPEQEAARYYVIPGFLPETVVPPAHCLSKRLKRERSRIVEIERRIAVEPAYCIGTIGGGAPPSATKCSRFSAVYTGGGIAAAAFASVFEEVPTVELAPDGVASVRLTFAGSRLVTVPVIENAYIVTVSSPAERAKLRSELSKLGGQARRDRKDKRRERKDIARLIELFQRARHEAVSQVEWLDPAGNVVRTFKPRPDEISEEAQLLKLILGGPPRIFGALGG